MSNLLLFIVNCSIIHVQYILLEASAKNGCDLPSNITFAKMRPLKDSYLHGENITVYCEENKNSSAKFGRLECQHGNWLAELPFPHCSSGVLSI